MFPLLIRLKSRSLLTLFILLITAILIWLPIKIPFSPFHLPEYTPLFKYYAYWYPACRIGDFIAGILLYRLWQARKEINSALATLLQGASVVILSAFYSWHENANEIYRYDFYYAIPMAFLIYTFAFQNGTFARLISNRVLVILGEASFAFYMIHQLAIGHLNFRIVRYNNTILELFHMKEQAEYAVFIHLLIAIILSLALFYLFERPAQKISHKLLFALKNRMSGAS